MNVGEPIPPIKSKSIVGDRKMGLEAGAEMVMEKIMALIPEEDRLQVHSIKDETFDVEIIISDKDGNIQKNILVLETDLREALGMFFHYPVLLDALSRNLQLFVHPLQEPEQFHEFSQIRKACLEILSYLEENPGFFTFRFGIDIGINVQIALREIANTLEIEAFQGWKIRFDPIYQYNDLRDGQRHLVRGVKSLHDMHL
jgi:hypothetical protein